MLRILVCVGHYLPGYKGGGPIRSIANLVDVLGDEYDFNIMTSDRDLGDHVPYPGIQSGVWQAQGKSKVLYLSPKEQTFYAWYKYLRTFTYDLVYLNSCFTRSTIYILILRLLGLIPRVPLVLAPRGEFSPGALDIKTYKKRPYLLLSNVTGMYKAIIWHATSSDELDDIRKQIVGSPSITFAGTPSIQIASDVASINIPPRLAHSTTKKHGELHVIFLSRISRKKNLHYALNLLGYVTGDVYFDIYGPIEDKAYWQECQQLIDRLPLHVRAQYCGMVPHQQVAQVFASHDLFLFPTRGENFGHVILESLKVGCPVLISDQTPWHDLEENGVGWELPLSDLDRFKSILETCIVMDQVEYTRMSISAQEYASRYCKRQTETIQQEYRELFSV